MVKKLSANQEQERGMISPFQLSLLVITSQIATSDIFLPAFIAQEAGRDSWISVLIGGLFSLIIVNIFLTLGLRHPDRTLIQYSCDLLGKPTGKIVGLLFILFFLSISWMTTRKLGEIYVTSFNQFVPIVVIFIITIAVSAFAVLNGIESIARVNEVLLPIGISVLILIAILNIQNMDMGKFLPVLYNGIVPPLKGSLLILAWVVRTILVLQLIPFTKRKEKIRTSVNFAIGLLILSLLLGTLITSVFGEYTKKLIIPALEYVRYAKLDPFIQNFDITIIVVWISGIFIEISLTFYVSVHCIAQLFSLKSYKNLIVPTGILIITFATISPKSLIELLNFLHYIFPFYVIAMALVLPLILLFASLIKGSTTKKQSIQG